MKLIQITNASYECVGYAIDTDVAIKSIELSWSAFSNSIITVSSDLTRITIKRAGFDSVVYYLNVIDILTTPQHL